jgi:hypothetical protein
MLMVPESALAGLPGPDALPRCPSWRTASTTGAQGTGCPGEGGGAMLVCGAFGVCWPLFLLWAPRGWACMRTPVCARLLVTASSHFRCFGFVYENLQRYLVDMRVGPTLRELNGSVTIGPKRSPYNLLVDDRHGIARPAPMFPWLFAFLGRRVPSRGSPDRVARGRRVSDRQCLCGC